MDFSVPVLGFKHWFMGKILSVCKNCRLYGSTGQTGEKQNYYEKRSKAKNFIDRRLSNFLKQKEHGALSLGVKRMG